MPTVSSDVGYSLMLWLNSKAKEQGISRNRLIARLLCEQRNLYKDENRDLLVAIRQLYIIRRLGDTLL
jgi:hypothetical protein